MSASREKKTRQDLTGAEFTDPKTAREAKQRKDAKRSNTIYAIVAIAFVIVAVVSIGWKSNILQKTATAATINGEKYGVAEVSYYYHSMVSQSAYYLQMMGIDTTDLKNQQYTEDQTWYDMFLDQAFQQMITVKALNDAAEADGFTWNDELQAQLDASLESIKSSVASSGQYTSFSQYLSANYGGTMTEKTYTEITKDYLLALAYSDAHSASLTYTQDEIDAAYAASPNTYDKVAYESVRISGSVPTTDAEGNEVEVTDEMKAEAMAAAQEAADKMLADYKAGGSLETLANANENAAYTNSKGVAYSSDTLGTWLFDSARKAGDSAVLKDDATSACFVVTFHERFRDEYPLVNVRHILAQVDSSALDKEAETYEADLQALKDAAKARAEDLLAQWKSGEATEDSFAALAQENSDDTGSAVNGGLISDIAKDSNLVTSFKDWCFEDGRKTGDTGIVESEYGYHIMYCSGFGLPYWQTQVTKSLTNDAMSAWYAEQTEGYTVEQGSGMRYVG